MSNRNHARSSAAQVTNAPPPHSMLGLAVRPNQTTGRSATLISPPPAMVRRIKSTDAPSVSAGESKLSVAPSISPVSLNNASARSAKEVMANKIEQIVRGNIPSTVMTSPPPQSALKAMVNRNQAREDNSSHSDDDWTTLAMDESSYRDEGQSNQDDDDWAMMDLGESYRDDENSSPQQNRPRIMGISEREDASTVDVRNLETLRGRVARVQKYNDWGRGMLIPESGGASISIVGSGIADLQKGDSVILHGKHKKHPSYGDQFDAILSTPDATSIPALVNHLVKNFKGVGQQSANRIVSYYKDNNQIEALRKQLIYTPSTLDFSEITGRKSELIDDDNTKQGRISTLLSLQYSSLGIRSDTLNRLARAVRLHIESLRKSDLLKLIQGIEENKERAKATLTTVSEVKRKDIPVPTPAPNPVPTLSDEQYVGQMLADYEQQNNLIEQGYQPETVYAQAPGTPTAFENGVERDGFLDSEDWDEYQEKQFKAAETDEVHAARILLADDPFHWIDRVEGYTFKTADRIAREEGIAPDDSKRLRALVAFALEAGCQSQGHTYIDEDFLQYAVTEVDKRVNGINAISEALESGLIEKENDRYYPKGTLEREKRLSSHIANRISFQTEPLAGYDISMKILDEVLDVAQKAVGEKKGVNNFKLDETQRAAVKGILTSESSLHVIEGGPGRGKTAIVQVLMETLVRMGKKPETAFCAPVGKAAKVLNSQIGDYGTAETIHSLLGARGARFEFSVNAENPLAAELAVADEQSMTGLNLGIGLFDAVKARSHIIMLGDTNQLLPIDCGNVMKSVVALDGVDKYMLTVTHRNKGKILSLVDMVNEGNWPCSPKEIESIESDGDVLLHSEKNSLSIEKIENFIDRVEAATKEYGGAEHVGVICPMRRGNINTPAWNVTYLNQALRDRLNPDPDRKKAIIGSPYRIDDRVILTKNMRVMEFDADAADNSVEIALGGDSSEESPKVRVANGDTGYLREAIIANVEGTKQAIGFVIDLDDGRSVLIGNEEKENIGLAYAITVHAAQGSEYEKVFGVVTPGHSSFMHRALMMTMLSRAKSSLEVFGPTQYCAQVVGRTPPVRNCAIFERAEDLIQQFQDKDEQEQDPQDECEFLRPAVGM